jgi:plasmid maintenance system antidote protein VapI
MKKSFIGAWAGKSKEREQLLDQERLLLGVSELLWETMEQQQVSGQELAQRLNCTKSHISQVLNGSRNMTLRTLSDIAGALEKCVEIRLRDRQENWMRVATSLHAGAVSNPAVPVRVVGSTSAIDAELSKTG